MNDFSIFIDAATHLPESQRDYVLDRDYLILPPSNSVFQYWCTPKHSLCFAAMGVDGVHNIICEIDGAVRDESPVFQVSPTDTDNPYCLLGNSFAEYLASGCKCSLSQIRDLLIHQRKGQHGLIGFVSKNFKRQNFDLDGFGSEYSRYVLLLSPTWEAEGG